MPRISRLIIYEADSDVNLAHQMANSLCEGMHHRGKIKITVINLQSDPVVNGFVDETVKDMKVIDFNEDR